MIPELERFLKSGLKDIKQYWQYFQNRHLRENTGNRKRTE